MVYDCLYKAVYNAVDRVVFFNKTGKTIAEWIDENIRDEEDDGNAIDIQISRKMITGRVKTFINEYITTANNRYKLDIPKFDISELLINLKI